MSKKIISLLTVFLMFSLIAAPGIYAGFGRRVKRAVKTHVRRSYNNLPAQKTITISTASYEECAAINIKVPRTGTVKITFSGEIELSDPDDVAYLTIADSPDIQGNNVIRTSWSGYTNFNIEEIFEVTSGNYTFYLNADGTGPLPARTFTVNTYMSEAFFVSDAMDTRDY